MTGLNLSGLLDSLYSFGHKLSYRPPNEVILNVLESEDIKEHFISLPLCPDMKFRTCKLAHKQRQAAAPVLSAAASKLFWSGSCPKMYIMMKYVHEMDNLV